MQNAKCIQFLKTLLPAEFSRFDKYVKSPYFHVHEDTIRFFSLLQTHYPNFSSKDLDKKALYHQLYPNTAYDEKKLYDLSKYLLRLLENFMIDQKLQQAHQPYLKQIFLEVLVDRQLEKYIPAKVKTNAEELKSSPFRDSEFYYASFQHKDFESWFALAQDNRSISASHEAPMKELDKYYIIQKLKYACAILNRQQMSVVDEKIELIDAIIQYCEEQAEQLDFSIQIYYQSLMTLKYGDDETYFYLLKDLIKQHLGLLPTDEQSTLFALAINYCTRKYRRGNMQFLQEMFELYQQMLKYNLLFTDPVSAGIYYKNLVTLGIKLQQYSWTENFIQEYRAKLKEDSREGIYAYSMANLLFAQSAYKKAMKLLQKVEFIDPYYRLFYNMLLMKVYYECGEIESLLSLCDTFAAYIRRNKSLSQNNQIAYNNMARFLRKMIKAKDSNLKQYPKIKKQLENCKLLVERNWINEKMEELKVQYERRYQYILK